MFSGGGCWWSSSFDYGLLKVAGSGDGFGLLFVIIEEGLFKRQ